MPFHSYGSVASNAPTPEVPADLARQTDNSLYKTFQELIDGYIERWLQVRNLVCKVWALYAAEKVSLQIIYARMLLAILLTASEATAAAYLCYVRTTSTKDPLSAFRG
jgi:hypothetical protein